MFYTQTAVETRRLAVAVMGCSLNLMFLISRSWLTKPRLSYSGRHI